MRPNDSTVGTVRRGLILTALATAALIAWWSKRETDTPAPGPDLPEALAEEPDLYLLNSTISQYHPDGALNYHLKSARIQHFDREPLTRLASPDLEMHPLQPATPWYVTSDLGYVRKRPVHSTEPEEVVFLRSNVRMRNRQQDGHDIRIATESIYIYPARQFAETDQDVMIDSDVGRTTANGLKGNLTSGQLLLSSNETSRVHTIILPEQFKSSGAGSQDSDG